MRVLIRSVLKQVYKILWWNHIVEHSDRVFGTHASKTQKTEHSADPTRKTRKSSIMG